jgi:hypothetical protein
MYTSIVNNSSHYQGLDGKLAAWAGKKYHGHCMLPQFLLADFGEGY